MDTQDFLAEMEEAFSDGISRGWAAGAKPVKSKEFPGMDVIKTESGKFIITDAFSYNAVGRGFGFTLINHKEIGEGKIPLWIMSYYGIYPESVTPFLKEVLLFAYKKGKFVGGRGMKGHEKNGLIYRNCPTDSQGKDILSFDDFKGVERITNVSGVELGWHQCWGMSLLV